MSISVIVIGSSIPQHFVASNIKCQVFVNHEGDMFRTRLTHSIEVAQIGRIIARALNVNEDLTEVICLAHALDHAGQDALNACMQEYGGFEHIIPYNL